MTEKLSEKMREDVKWRRQYKTYEIDDLVPIVEALEAEVKNAIDAGEEWRTKWVEEESWRKGLEARLEKAESVMINYHCETFLNFPDEAICGASKRPCKRYFLCESMKEALTVGNEGGGQEK